jgi:putative transposase
MRSKPVALLLADLGVVKTHSRPYVSNDNPFSEAHFRTLKYCPQFPDRFGSIEDGRAFGQDFFRWYNQDHRHSGLGFLTPAVVHFGQAEAVRAHRDRVLAAAYALHPERFVNGRPQPADLPNAVWINPPVKKATAQDAPGATIARPDGPQHGRIIEATRRSTAIMIDGGAPLINSTLVSQCH